MPVTPKRPTVATLSMQISELNAKLELARATWREQQARIAHLERMAAIVEEVITADDRKKCAALWNRKAA